MPLEEVFVSLLEARDGEAPTRGAPTRGVPANDVSVIYSQFTQETVLTLDALSVDEALRRFRGW